MERRTKAGGGISGLVEVENGYIIVVWCSYAVRVNGKCLPNAERLM